MTGTSQFRLRLLLQLGFLLPAVFLFCYSVLVESLPVTALLSAALVLLFTVNIFRLVDTTERGFARFLENIEHGDFAALPADKRLRESNRGRELLAHAQRRILAKMQQLNREREADHRYLAMVVEHVDTALLCYDRRGEVEIFNGAAKRLLGLESLLKVSRLAAVDPGLSREIISLSPGRRKVVKAVIGGEVSQLLLSATEFSLPGKDYRLLSLQNVKQALDEKEIESWQKLLRILNHEIMNSMTPIVSLSRYVESVMGNSEKRTALAAGNADLRRDLLRSVSAIHSRSRGLVDFIGAYRSLQVHQPEVIAGPRAAEILERIKTLFEERCSQAGIELRRGGDLKGASLLADPKSLEQVLINLVSNAIDAVAGRPLPRIDMVCEADAGQVRIHVKDNGCGIGRAGIEDIFTPFFTTKAAGSGIGLSISRQLVQLGGGSLTVRSSEGNGSIFTITLPCT